VLAVLALLLAAPFERRRDCDVCPVDCPMHAPKRVAGKPGCHHGAAHRPAHAPADDGACAMRAACGTHGAAVTPLFHAELPPAVIAVAGVARGFVAVPELPLVAADAAAPLHRPPEPFVVHSI
jgi:hypothetical protein